MTDTPPPPASRLSQEEEHLNLLSIFHFVVAGLTALLSCTFLIHIAMGIVFLNADFEGEEPPPDLFAWIFIAFPGVMMLLGWSLAAAMVAAGLKLRRRVSRTFCMVVGGIECLLVPFGTVLGVFTLILLSRESVRARFPAENSNPVS
jgi:hypothetical protein